MDTNPGARVVNILLGGWLILSASLWPHHPQQQVNAWVCGFLTAVIAVVGARIGPVRYLNVILSIWLFLSVWLLPTVTVKTAWNSTLVGMAILIATLIPRWSRRPKPV